MKRSVLKKLLAIGCGLSFIVMGSACGPEDFFHGIGDFADYMSGHRHSLMYKAAQEPTCTEVGNIAHYYCVETTEGKCGKYWADEKGEAELSASEVYISKIPHDLEHHEEIESTCSKRGMREYYECKACGTQFEDEQGTQEFHINDLSTPTKSHTLVYIQGKEATCTEDGEKAHYLCTVCGALYNEYKTYRIEASDLVIPAGHQVATSWSSDDFQHWHKYTCEHAGSEPKEDHTVVDGVCTVCEQRLYSVGLAYELNADGKSAKVTGMGSCTSDYVYIAATYEGVPVTEVADGAFSGSGIWSVYLPSTMRKIGNNAFSNCTSLGVTLQEGLESIGDYAFYNTGVWYLTLPDSVTSVGDYAFAKCGQLKEFRMGNASLGARAVEGCKKLKKVTIEGSGDAVIGAYAFNDCTGVDNLSMSGVKEIKEGAFYGCTALKSVTIPSQTLSIGEQAFRGCSNLTRVNIPSTVVTMGAEVFVSTSLHVYTQAASKPEGWDENWASQNVKIHWGEYQPT